MLIGKTAEVGLLLAILHFRSCPKTELGNSSEVDMKMPVTSYKNYLRELKTILDRVRDRPFDYKNALIEMAIYKNGFGYKARETLGRGRLISEYQMGPLNSNDSQPDDKRLGRAEIDEFFDLPEIYAYSDRALVAPRTPLSASHWDAAIGLFEVLICERNGMPKRQRMLFAGFQDRIHAEFFLAVDHDLIVHDHNPGSQLFEWRSNETNQPIAPILERSSIHPTNGPRIRWPLRNVRSFNPAG